MVPGGWLEFLGQVRLDDQFDRDAEERRLQPDAAEAIVQKRIEAIQATLTRRFQRRSTFRRLNQAQKATLTDRVQEQLPDMDGRADAEKDELVAQAVEGELMMSKVSDAISKAVGQHEDLTREEKLLLSAN